MNSSMKKTESHCNYLKAPFAEQQAGDVCPYLTACCWTRLTPHQPGAGGSLPVEQGTPDVLARHGEPGRGGRWPICLLISELIILFSEQQSELFVACSLLLLLTASCVEISAWVCFSPLNSGDASGSPCRYPGLQFMS